jgi:NAD(P)-dependent dehydrogenase (short-subunit alcohol dehydrogenase family)
LLVNNAEISLRGTIEELSAEDFARQQQVNDTAPFLIIQACPAVNSGSPMGSFDV